MDGLLLVNTAQQLMLSSVTELSVNTVKPWIQQTTNRYWLHCYCSQWAHNTRMIVLTHNKHKHTDYTVDYICSWKTLQTNVGCWHCVDVFRRPEGKFKKKQTPRDEALQILKPQMDNPPAPQVRTHTDTQRNKQEHTVTECKQYKVIRRC